MIAAAKASRLRELLFRISVGLKGLDGVLELIGGAALLVIEPDVILRIVLSLTQDEMKEDPRDFVARHALSFAQNFSISTQHFVALYLLAHGLVKVLLVWALLKEKIWAYPLGIVVFGALIVYQLYRFTLTHSIGLIALSSFDIVVIGMVWLEYRAARRQALAA